MITIYKTTEHGLEVVPEVCKGCWISAVDPSPNEIAWLQEFSLPEEFILYGPAGWYTNMVPTVGEYYRCGTCDVPSATVPRAGELCLKCRLQERTKPLDGAT